LYRNCPLKYVTGEKGNEKDDVSRYWMTLSKRESTAGLQRKHEIAFF
jgi:hypothetical protein